MRIPVAIYPYCSELLPIVKHFEDLQDKYSIARLFSPAGLGLGGKDAAHARNHPNVGHIVLDGFKADETSWEVLFLTRVNQLHVFDEDTICDIANKTLSAGKRIIYFDNSKKDVPEQIRKLSEIYPVAMTIITEDMHLDEAKRGDGNYKVLEIPIVLVGGLFAAEDTLEVLLGLASCLKKQGVNTTVVSKHCHAKMSGLNYHCLNHLFYDGNITEVAKIMAVNLCLKNLEQTELPDIILIEAPDSVMRYNNIAPHGFGIYTYMLGQAIKPDYFICCVPTDLAISNLLAEISKDLSVRLGAVIDAVHVSNIIIDSANVTQAKKVSYVYANLDTVKKQIQKQGGHSEIPFFDVVSDGVGGICSILFG
ncbi:MAG: hypothetical protein FWG91_10710 [Lachnospiraceae bacterium]|nr:hypothetical protein [Lachnospiraceae bacterium]